MLALAIATCMLSTIFLGDILKDPRLPSIKRLAWAWSIANLVLALAVYHRLLIYINFNGMTRMRVLGLFGISTVVVGFLLVVWKIHKSYRFVWLIQHHLWTLSLAIYLLVLTPVDYLVHAYNLRQILAGHLAPSVQITEHPVDLSGWLVLQGLVDCENEIIREGIRSKLAEMYYEGIPVQGTRRQSTHWTTYQFVQEQLKSELGASPEIWQPYESEAHREVAWVRFSGTERPQKHSDEKFFNPVPLNIIQN